MIHTDLAQLAADAGDIDTQRIVIYKYLIIPQIINDIFSRYDLSASGKQIPADAKFISGKLRCLSFAGQGAV